MYPFLWYNNIMSEMIESKDLQQNSASFEELKNKYAMLQHENEILTAKLKWYEEQYKLNQAKRFGKSSDTVPAEQISFLNEAEIAQRPEAEEPELEKIVYERKKRRRGTNKDSFADLPVERIEYDLPIDEQICAVCNGTMHSMSEEVRRELKVIPAQVSIVEHVRKIYTCRACEKAEEKAPIITAPMPAPVISGSFVSPSLLAFIMHQKYVAALPLHRQEQIFKEYGIDISRQSMANWIIKGAELWLEPLYDRMHQYLLKETFLHADESPMRVLTKDGKPTDSKAYMWLYATGRYGRKMALYEYQPSRSGKHAKRFLEGYSGLLQSDDYSGYNSVENVIRVGCFAHARRYYTDALKVIPKGVSIESTYAHQALEFFKELFTLESRWTEISAEKRYENRLKESKPVLEAYLSWLQEAEPKVVKKSKLGQAIAYSLSNWELLTNFMKDGQCELSNNRAERAIKPFVIGRKNFLFAKSPHGAKASAIAYSIAESAKLNGLNTFYYMKYLFEQLPNTRLDRPEALDHLLPWSEEIPAECRLQKKL